MPQWGVSVLVCFHAHPDDEVFSTGGVMRLAAEAGHRVVLVTATDGALGEAPEGLLGETESLAERRWAELLSSADALGVARVVTLDHPDSGMAGTPDNARPEAFCNVDVEVAAARLAQLLVQERADVLTVYDPHGNYGHPDHVQVHVVGVRAAELAGVQAVYEATSDRAHMRSLVRANPAWLQDEGAPDVETLGLPPEEITTRIDVTSVLSAKRAAMAAHATQVGDFGPFLAMGAEALAAAFGSEVFRRRGPRPGGLETALPL